MRTDSFDRNLKIETIQVISTADTQNSVNVVAEIVGPDEYKRKRVANIDENQEIANN